MGLKNRYSTICLLWALANCVHAGAWQMHTIDSSSQGADGVRLADVNGDGLPDVVTGWEEAGQVRLYLHPGYVTVRKPWRSELLGRVSDPEDAVAMKVAGQSVFISSTERQNQKLYIHHRDDSRPESVTWNTTPISNSWSPEPIAVRACRVVQLGRLMRAVGLDDLCWRGRMPQRWMYALPLAWNGRPAFVAGSKEHNGTITLFEHGGGSIADWRATPLARVGWTMSIVQINDDRSDDIRLVYSDRRGSDLDGNGRLDDSIDPKIEPSAPSRGIFALENKGGHWSRRELWRSGDEVMFLYVGDVNSDGRGDIVAATKGGYVIVLEAKGRGVFTAKKIPLPVGVNRDLKAVAVGDMDGDGVPDLVFSVETAKRDDLRVFMAQLDYSNLRITKVIDIAGRVGQKFDRLELVDLNGDGCLDVLTTEENAGLGVIWFENPFPGCRAARKSGR